MIVPISLSHVFYETNATCKCSFSISLSLFGARASSAVAWPAGDQVIVLFYFMF